MEVSGYQQRFGYQHSSKYLLLCSTEGINSYRFVTTWGWENWENSFLGELWLYSNLCVSMDIFLYKTFNKGQFSVIEFKHLSSVCLVSLHCIYQHMHIFISVTAVKQNCCMISLKPCFLFRMSDKKKIAKLSVWQGASISYLSPLTVCQTKCNICVCVCTCHIVCTSCSDT